MEKKELFLEKKVSEMTGEDLLQIMTKAIVAASHQTKFCVQ